MKRTFLVEGFGSTLGSKMGNQTCDYQAVIRCAGPSGELLEIYFLDRERGGTRNNPDTLPNKSEMIDGNQVYGRMWVPIQQYGFYIDLLRNQEPIKATVGFSGEENATGISTGDWEAPGAGEVLDSVS